MRLSQWVSERGRGEVNRIARATTLSYATVSSLAHDRHLATYRVGKLISDATGGRVSVAELCEPRAADAAVDLEARANKRRQRRRRARARARSAANRGG